ncbi:MAG: DNA polymerase II [Methanomassiliicoccales archaeon]|nr:MAG: DNA polymerase II [Methanomassiliicoccales archaeon]
MDNWDVRILTGSYIVEDGKPVVELFGKTRDDRSITVRYKGFLPYFHVIATQDEVASFLGEDPDILDMKNISLLHNGKEKEATKVTVRIPATVPRYRSKLQSKYTVLAADIPFQHRFIYDLDLGSCIRVMGNEVTADDFTTDLVVEADKFEECEPFKPNLKILSFDIENSLKDGRIFTICCVIESQGKMEKEQLKGEETAIIQDWIEVIKKYDPDVITGYNIDGYDLPVILDRASKLGLDELPIGRNLKPAKSVDKRFWRLNGRIIADAWWNVKRELRPKKETLSHIAETLLGQKKDDVDPKKIDEEWDNNPDKVVEYCLQDARLALNILKKIRVLGKAMDLATVSKLPLDDAINGRTSTFIDSILIREADRANAAVPLSGGKGGREKIEGGYVHSIEPGLYDMVCVLDFKSMYPSLIIANNICFTTLDPDGSIKSPVGVHFLSKKKREGLVPRVLIRLMKDRDEFKAKMKLAKKKGDEESFVYYNGLQEAVKVLMNAIYGVFASSFYRFTNRDIGSSITAFARQSVKKLIAKLEKEGLKVIYSDTDSVFFESPKKDLPDTVKFGEKTAKRFSVGGAVLEFERVLDPLFSHGKKKRYVGKVVWPEEGMMVRGYEIRRTDAFDLQSEALTHIFQEVLKRDPDEAVSTAKKIVNDILKGEVEKEKLVISRTVKPERSYVNPDRMVNVLVARKLKEMGYEFVPGMKVSWIVTNSKKTPQEVEPYIDGRIFEGEPDWEYYAKRVAMTIARVTEVFGWDERTLLGGGKQKTLFSEEFESSTKKKSKDKGKPKKSDKKLTIEDFL